MKTRLASATLFAAYQLSLLAGILLLPIAVIARHIGLTIPIHRLIEPLQDAYEDE